MRSAGHNLPQKNVHAHCSADSRACLKMSSNKLSGSNSQEGSHIAAAMLFEKYFALPTSQITHRHLDVFLYILDTHFLGACVGDVAQSLKQFNPFIRQQCFIRAKQTLRCKNVMFLVCLMYSRHVQ